MTDPVAQIIPLGFQWTTVDPFLFCVHHLDRYPAANEHLGPAASLEARDLGMDFSGSDGWSMYHGSIVPGFPQHPHRGFETVTFARQGFIDHSDSLGATARFGRGDVQWLTAGGGIVHCEMFPLLDRTGPNPCELFQIWLNLPASDKMVDPYFTMLWGEDIPTVVATDDAGRTSAVTVIAGALEGVTPLAAPPNSWASRPDADLAIWHLTFEPFAGRTLPPAAGPDTARTLYVFEGSVAIGEHNLEASSGALLRAAAGHHKCWSLRRRGPRPAGAADRRAGGAVRPVRDERQGRHRAGLPRLPEDGIRRLAVAHRRPRPSEDAGRFARHANGRLEERDPLPTPSVTPV